MPKGSKPGERRGGRKKGTPNRVTEKRREVAEQALAQGITPLEVMLQTMRMLWNEAQGPDGLLDADKAKAAALIAREAAPYVHPKLAPRGPAVKLPGLDGSLADKGRQVLEAITNGELAPDDALPIMQSLVSQARVVEVTELEKRIAALEGNQNGKT